MAKKEPTAADAVIGVLDTLWRLPVGGMAVIVDAVTGSNTVDCVLTKEHDERAGNVTGYIDRHPTSGAAIVMAVPMAVGSAVIAAGPAVVSGISGMEQVATVSAGGAIISSVGSGGSEDSAASVNSSASQSKDEIISNIAADSHDALDASMHDKLANVICDAGDALIEGAVLSMTPLNTAQSVLVGGFVAGGKACVDKDMSETRALMKANAESNRKAIEFAKQDTQDFAAENPTATDAELEKFFKKREQEQFTFQEGLDRL